MQVRTTLADDNAPQVILTAETIADRDLVETIAAQFADRNTLRDQPATLAYPLHNRVAAYLLIFPGEHRADDVATALRANRSAVMSRLSELARTGFAVRVDKGLYRSADLQRPRGFNAKAAR